MTKKINKLIKFIERLISFALNLIWIPAFIDPPKGAIIDFITTDWYVLAGKYTGTFEYYPAKYTKVYGWRWRGQVSLPKLKGSFKKGRFANITTHIVGGTEASNWVQRQKHLKNLQEDPFYTTLPEKKKEVQEFKDRKNENKELLMEDVNAKTRDKIDEKFN